MTVLFTIGDQPFVERLTRACEQSSVMPLTKVHHATTIEAARQTLYSVQARRTLVVIDGASCDIGAVEPLITQALWVNNRVLLVTPHATDEPTASLAAIDGVIVLEEPALAEHFARSGLRDFLNV